MRVLRLTSMSLLAALLAAGPSSSAQPSPFAPGGPLAPWTGPPPPPRTAPEPVDQTPPPPSAARQPPADTYRVGPSPAPVDRDWKPLGADDRPSTCLSAFFNPALMRFGKTTGHVELAPYGPHALFFEFSKLSLDLKDKIAGQTYSVQVDGWEYDFGYHLFPLGRGARGFYLGPRYVRGSGGTQGASGKFTGWGGDLGYQWVVADHLVINLGAGAMYISGSAELDPTIITQTNLPDVDTSGFETLSSGSGSYLLPLGTLGVGLAI